VGCETTTDKEGVNHGYSICHSYRSHEVFRYGSNERHFLIDRLFEKEKANLVYSHVDRIIAGGVCPVETELKLEVTRELGVDTFSKTEMGSSNIGSTGTVSVDGKKYPLGQGVYLRGMGSKEYSSRARIGTIREILF